MTASALIPNPAGAGATAPIFVTHDGGDTWILVNLIPSAGITGDVTLAEGDGRLHVAALALPDLLLKKLVTDNEVSPRAMDFEGQRNQVDQPFVQAEPVGKHVYMAGNDFDVQTGRTALIDASQDAGATYSHVRLESRDTMGQNGASVRVALAQDGTVYAAYFGLRDFTHNILTSDVVVVRDDHFGRGANAFAALADDDKLPGRRVVSGIKIPWSTGPELGQERIGSTLALAAAPRDSSTVYVAWGDRVGFGDIYTVHLRRSTDRGLSWTGDLRVLTNATCVALAVANNGTVGFLYHQLVDSPRGMLWTTHLEQSRDRFDSFEDTVLSAAPAALPAQFLPYLGDYNYLTAADGEFRGVFAANNLPDLQDFPNGVTYQRHANFSTQTLDDGSDNVVPVSIDPFYFSVPVLREKD